MKSSHNVSPPAMPEPDEQWEISGRSMYRAASFAVALPAFMIGTALFMLGFSLNHATILQAACILYSISFAGFLTRWLVNRQVWPRALPYIVCIAAAGAGFYLLLQLALLALRHLHLIP